MAIHGFAASKITYFELQDVNRILIRAARDFVSGGAEE
jgi:hypothetical protein